MLSDTWAIICELCIYGRGGVGQYSTFLKTIYINSKGNTWEH